MKDQVDKAKERGLKAEFLNSSLSFAEQKQVMDVLQTGNCDLLYVAPERFALSGFRRQITNLHVSLFAIDEAHCISEWGHDFRPDYLNLARIKHDFPRVPIAAFTATATPRVQEDTIRRLNLHAPHTVIASFNRPNLFYAAQTKTDVNAQVLAYIQSHPDCSGIIYRTTRNDVVETAMFLQDAGISALPYHAGMEADERRVHQDAFILGHCRVIVATIAFGMGIDKPDVRFVIHGDLPKSISGYYQETGRAGRDGKPSLCLLFFDRKDMARHHYFIDKIEDARLRAVAEDRLGEMISFASTRRCRRHWLLSYFGETSHNRDCKYCDVCRPGVVAPIVVAPRKHGLSTSVSATLQLARQGMSKLTIARTRNLKPTTIVSHLEQLINSGAVDVDRHISTTRRNYIERLFTKLGTDQLKSVVEFADGKVSYDEARLVRAAMQRGEHATASSANVG